MPLAFTVVPMSACGGPLMVERHTRTYVVVLQCLVRGNCELTALAVLAAAKSVSHIQVCIYGHIDVAIT